MIFDSPVMAKLLAKYVGQPDYDVPAVVYLARSPRMAADRAYMEELISNASLENAKRRDWLNRLVKEDYRQYKAAWFEIMLSGWLAEVGATEVEPKLEGNDPDFAVTIDSLQIVVEAYTLLEYEEERTWQRRVSELRGVLEEVEMPYWITVDAYEMKGPLDRKRLRQEVARWLAEQPSRPYTFTDANGNSVALRGAVSKSQTSVGVIGPSRSSMVDNGPLKQPLRAKAGQHKAIRSAGYPYVIAVLLDAWELSAESVAEAWMGKTRYVWDASDADAGKFVADVRSGLHIFGSEVRHTTVSGTLAFRAVRDSVRNRNALVGWYIENPYAKVQLDPGTFPVHASYHVINRSERSFTMDWRTRDTANDSGG